MAAKKQVQTAVRDAAGVAPRVSVILPTYNRAALLRLAIESVFAQTFDSWELIVIDDGSTDGTEAVLREFAARDSRVSVIRNAPAPFEGIWKPLNQGLRAARGEFIARLDDDDRWMHPEKLAKQVAFLDANPDHVAVGGGVVVVDGDRKELFRYFKRETDAEIRRHALLSNPFSHTTVVFRAEPARAIGGYGAWRYAEDWDLWLTLGASGKLHNIQEYFMEYLLAGQNKSFLEQRAMSRMIISIISRHRKEYPNFIPAYAVNLGQLAYSYLPLWFRRPMHAFLSSVKRGL